MLLHVGASLLVLGRRKEGWQSQTEDFSVDRQCNQTGIYAGGLLSEVSALTFLF